MRFCGWYTELRDNRNTKGYKPWFIRAQHNRPRLEGKRSNSSRVNTRTRPHHSSRQPYSQTLKACPDDRLFSVVTGYGNGECVEMTISFEVW